ncbi:type III-B CRISPR module RAMP protein Cmr4 [Arcicella aquatica]|uniref:Type III-B CRISPR module RAMP protein Cmr4 n=1 Tax=Arcicella aquatica TaxID=217141 RepID=A0ABU5QVF7_9BACT|nr:type III-B CRISPR module RAMP protein Cmr4 [Arcicella aquatica]MEA5260331.1 type III-B CRISPR module RAMP protein Cmr4 [Arcicella aquatica]
MKSTLFIIKNITNLHAGDGDSSDGLIDKTVQRDPTTRIPVIHASSLKGSLREHFKNLSETASIFGKEPKKEASVDANKGSHIFWDARLLALPIQDDSHGYVLATTQDLIDDFKEVIKLCAVASTDKLATLTNPVEKLTNKPLRVLSNTEFEEHCERLHVIARNNLENGKSVNLWYEEVVPRQALFYAVIQHPETESPLISKIKETNLIQIGANATIGYGQCQFTVVN